MGAVGGLCGLTNGLVITRLRVPPFVATLGMLSIARGLAVWLAERRVLAFPGPDPEWVKAFNQVHPATVFNPSLWSAAALAIVVIVLLRATVWGRYFYAVGANEAASVYSGVPIARTKIIVYTLAGLLTGWAGVLRFAHGTSGDPSETDSCGPGKNHPLPILFDALDLGAHGLKHPLQRVGAGRQTRWRMSPRLSCVR